MTLRALSLCLFTFSSHKILCPPDKIVIDEEEFRSLFQSKMTVTSKLLNFPDLASDRAVKVIDPKRANNGGIILARLRMSYDNIAKGVGRM